MSDKVTAVKLSDDGQLWDVSFVAEFQKGKVAVYVRSSGTLITALKYAAMVRRSLQDTGSLPLFVRNGHYFRYINRLSFMFSATWDNDGIPLPGLFMDL